MKTIVILHGWNTQLSRWRPVIEKLEKANLKVYFPLLPGFNDQKITHAFNTRDYVNWLENYFKLKKISSCVLLGHSLGGQIACQFSATHPNFVSQLVLVNSAGIRPTLTFKRLIFTPIAKIGKWFFELKLFKPMQAPFKELLYFMAREQDYLKSSPILKQTLINVINEDQQAFMSKIHQATLIIWGKLDKMTPLKYGQKIHALIKNSNLVIFPSSRHGLPFTHPKELVKQIIKFCKS